ncbi:septum formation family protein, partial [Actinacidiphila rubida]
DRIATVADEKCASESDAYLGDATLPDGLDIYYYLPPREGWDRGDRAVTCFFGSMDGRVTGSARTGGDSSGVGV